MGRWKGAVVLSLALGAAGVPGLASAADAPASVAATLETPSYFDDDAGGNANADDPAVWVHPTDPGKSLIAGTLKEGGLDVFDMSGNVVQHIDAPSADGDDESGRFNNVDIVQDARLGKRRLDIAIVSDRGMDIIRTYAINGSSDQPLTEITDPEAPWAFSSSQDEVNEQFTAYGLAAYRDGKNGVLVAASQRHESAIGLFRLTTSAGKVSYEKVDTIDLPSSFKLPDGSTWASCEDPGEFPQVEGMVFDRDEGTLYAAQESIGLWEIELDGDEVEDTELFEKVREFGVPWSYDGEADEECTVHYDQDPGFGGGRIAADAEGLTMYYAGDDDDDGYLLASSQGNDTFAVFEREAGDHDYLGSFGSSLDGDTVEHSDGAQVVNVPLGPGFEKGAFIVHDGHDTPDETDDDGEIRERTNFKYVPWQNIADPLDLEIETD